LITDISTTNVKEKNPEHKSEITPNYESADYRLEVEPAFAEKCVRENFPEFPIKFFKTLSRGMGNCAFLANGEYVFRFPKHEKANRPLATEINLLPKLAPKITLAIPRFEYVGKQIGNGLGLVGYKLIGGEKLAKETTEDAPGIPNPAIARQIANFFNELHGFSLAEARNCGVDEENLREFFIRQREDARNFVYPVIEERLPKKAGEITEKTELAFENYLDDPENFDYKPRLIHNDLEAEHILADPEKKIVTGIIDFGGAKLNDPDYDLWRPYFHFGRGFIEEMLKSYPHENPPRLFQKMGFFWTAQLVHRALRPILLKDDKKISWAIENLEKKVSET
jgi:aminoglycoside 2''-phosphotransferase